MVKFKTKNPVKGEQLIANRYMFIDGVFTCSDDDAVGIEPILTIYHDCDVEKVAAVVEAEIELDQNADTTLKAEVTKVKASK